MTCSTHFIEKSGTKIGGGRGGAVKYLVIFSTLPNQFRSFVSLGRCLQTKPLQLDLALSLCFFFFWNQFCQSFVSTAGKEYHENVSKNRKWEWNTNREKSLVKITNRIINKISVRYFCYFSALFIAYPYSYGLTYRNNNGNWLLTLSLSTQIVTSVLSDLLNFL